MKSSLRYLVVLMGALLLLGTNMATAQPGAPTFEYEWIKGHPNTATGNDAVLRVMMTGDCDDPNSPGLTLAGFNIAIEIDEGIVDETTSPVAGGGDKFNEIIPTSPSDLNAVTNTGESVPVREIADYRTIVDAYADPPHTVAPTEGRDEINAMLWDGSGFLVEEIAGAPAGKKWIIITGVSQRLIEKLPLGDIPSMRNALTDADPSTALGAGNNPAGLNERAAFLDIAFTFLGSSNSAERGSFMSSVKVLANPLASEIFAAEDALPDDLAATVPTDPVEVPTDGDTFADTDGSVAPAILQIGPETHSESWDTYR